MWELQAVSFYKDQWPKVHYGTKELINIAKSLVHVPKGTKGKSLKFIKELKIEKSRNLYHIKIIDIPKVHYGTKIKFKSKIIHLHGKEILLTFISVPSLGGIHLRDFKSIKGGNEITSEQSYPFMDSLGGRSEQSWNRPSRDVLEDKVFLPLTVQKGPYGVVSSAEYHGLVNMPGPLGRLDDLGQEAPGVSRVSKAQDYPEVLLKKDLKDSERAQLILSGSSGVGPLLESLGPGTLLYAIAYSSHPFRTAASIFTPP